MKTYIVFVSSNKILSNRKLKIRADSFECDFKNATVDFFIGNERIAVFNIDRIDGFYEKRC